MSAPRQIPLFAPLRPEELTPSALIRHTIGLFQEHLRHEGKTQHTITAFTSDLDLFIEYAGDTAIIGDITTRQLDDFLHWMEHERGVPCSRKTYARRVTTLKVYCKWLRDIEAIPRDPALQIAQRSGPAPLSLILTSEQIATVLAHAASLNGGKKPDARPEVLLRLLLDTGIKKGETAALKLEHLQRANPQRPSVLIKRQSAKDVYKERVIALDPDWLPLLDEYCTQYEIKDVLFPCTTRNLEYILEDLGDGAGIPFKVSFEILRWTCAVRDYLDGMMPDSIREKLGLSKISWYETFAKIKVLAGEPEAPNTPAAAAP